jgi:hypothetical protein
VQYMIIFIYMMFVDLWVHRPSILNHQASLTDYHKDLNLNMDAISQKIGTASKSKGYCPIGSQ